MEKIQITICLGTTCYVMGASELQNLMDFVPAHLHEQIDLRSSNCLDYCKEGEYGRAPFVLINGSVQGDATLHTILEKIKEFTGEDFATE